MAVDPYKPEKGVFAATFAIPTECACAVVKYDELLISNANIGNKGTKVASDHQPRGNYIDNTNNKSSYFLSVNNRYFLNR